MIQRERQDQIYKHRMTIAHDVLSNGDQQLVQVIGLLSVNIFYLKTESQQMTEEYFEMAKVASFDEETQKAWLRKPVIEQLAIIGAVAAAEIDRIKSMNVQPGEDLSSLQMYAQLVLGRKVRHRYFSDGEGMKLLPTGKYEFEDGIQISPDDFWKEKSPEWESGWTVVELSER